MQERQDDKDQSLAKTVSQYIITPDSVLHGCGRIGPSGLTGEVYSHAAFLYKNRHEYLKLCLHITGICFGIVL
jgi:hypothetical protein